MDSCPAPERRFYNGGSGVRIAADVRGSPGRPTVILAHGGGQTRHSWAGAMDQLASAGYQVVNYDTRGHGDSDWAADGAYRMRDRAEDLRAIIATLDGPVAIVGASMGGSTALYTAAMTPGLDIAALVLVDIVPRPDPEGVGRITAFMQRHLDGFDTLDDAVRAVAEYNPTRKRPADPEGLRKNLRERDGRLYWHWDPAILTLGPETEHDSLYRAIVEPARPLDFPVLLVRGLKSDIVSDEGIAVLTEHIPQTEVFDVAEAGHMVAGDRNDAFNDGVIGFLERHMPATAE